MKIELDAEDLQEMREEMLGVLDFEPTDAELRLAVVRKPSMAGMALEYGWSETQTRADLVDELEDIHAVAHPPRRP